MAKSIRMSDESPILYRSVLQQLTASVKNAYNVAEEYDLQDEMSLFSAFYLVLEAMAAGQPIEDNIDETGVQFGFTWRPEGLPHASIVPAGV